MSKIFPKGAIRVQDFLISKNSKSIVELLPESTATAQEAAEALGVELHQIGKSIVLGNENITVVAVVCGDQKVNIDILSKEIGASILTTLRADAIKQKTGFVIGGISPFSLPPNISVVIDKNLYNLSFCYVAAGHPKSVVKTSGQEITTLTTAKVLPIVR